MCILTLQIVRSFPLLLHPSLPYCWARDLPLQKEVKAHLDLFVAKQREDRSDRAFLLSRPAFFGACVSQPLLSQHDRSLFARLSRAFYDSRWVASFRTLRLPLPQLYSKQVHRRSLNKNVRPKMLFLIASRLKDRS